MRLVDADALKNRLQFLLDCLPDVAAPAQRQLQHDIDILDAQPTICCDGCEHYCEPSPDPFILNTCDECLDCRCGSNYRPKPEEESDA